MINSHLLGMLMCLLCGSTAFSQVNLKNKRATPIMGWSSWNHFRVNINEQLIKKQADALIKSGMKEAGYQYINIDDGFFGGRTENGSIIAHPVRFPGGMKKVADYIHSKGLKAGIYSDAGINTCASTWDRDTIGVGMGLFGHEEQDLRQMLGTWGYDFIKVDWCGAEKLKIDEEITYTRIGNLLKQINSNIIYNVCRWQFPGKWVYNVADSWRISGDISNNFESILKIIDLNADLWKYSGPGHVNDMDMLQVGRGMSYEEDKTHFSMWCMLASPLLAGNDLTQMSGKTLSILTNKEMIAINQDPLVYQARRIMDMGDLEIWARPLKSTMSGKIAVALLNRGKTNNNLSVDMRTLGIDTRRGYTVRNVWEKRTSSKQTGDSIDFNIESHEVKILVIDGTSLPFNIFQKD